MPERQAYIDESFQEHDTEGFYVLVAAVLRHNAAEIRTLLQGLAAHRLPGKLHWTESSARYRRAATERIADLDAFHVVAVGTPVAPRKQERARAICLRRLAFELNGPMSLLASYVLIAKETRPTASYWAIDCI